MRTENSESRLQTSDGYTPSELHQAETFMNSERTLTPKMVSSLLNVNVLLQSEHVHSSEKAEDTFSPLRAVLIGVVSIMIALTLGTSLLYINEIGPFYADAEGLESE